jgi:hypothetical protein
MLSLFGFGKKRRSPKSSKKSVRPRRKVVSKRSKPSAKVLKMCKKLKVKVTMKRGGRRMYKSEKVLVKQCKLKLKMLKRSKKVTRKVSKRKMMFGSRFKFGEGCGSNYVSDRSMSMFGARRIKFGGQRDNVPEMEFGKATRRRRVSGKRKVSKAAAMKAFREFYRRHCSSSLGVRRSRFGNGGTPPLYQSMGYEFCPLGSGGVLGANSTGLFPSPCHSMNRAEARREEAVKLPTRYSGSDKKPSSSFGRRR